ncbi:protein kinase [Streptomyces sp. NPDC059063]|uniref:protein kinase domain-containing protein n=1 Tax=unclassified Streptomyces TaxID=2593676 RepID=UPI0036C82580
MRKTPAAIGGYRVVARLGAGGMGRVHLARSASGRPVAVKTVHAHLATEPEFRERFRRETAAARAVTGPFTAAVLDADPDAERPWLATEFCAGPDLTEAVAAHGPLSAADLAALGAALAEALLAVHAAGLVHRDLKPANVVVTRAGPKVLDFGIAKSAADDSLTASDEAIGSPGFIAPEQLARGADGTRPGPPADVFALGAVLALAVTGRAPFGADGAARVLYRTLHEPPDLDAVPDPVLRTFLTRCLARTPEDRPTVADVLTWCGQRTATAPWWERGPVAELIRRHEDEVSRLLAPDVEGDASSGGSGGSSYGVRDVGTRPTDRLLPEPSVTAPLSDTPAPGPARRRLFLWGGGALAAAAAGTVAVAALTGDDGRRGGRRPARGPRGRVLWSRDVGDLNPRTLLRRGDDLYLLGADGLICLDARSDTVRWEYPERNIQLVERHRDTVYVLQDDLFEAEVHALGAATGRQVWTSPTPVLNPARRAVKPYHYNAPKSALEGDHGTFVLCGDVLCLLTYASYDTLWAQRSAWGRHWRAYGFDTRTHRALWFHEGDAAGVIGTDQAGGRIAVATSAHRSGGLADEEPRGPLVVLRADDGTVERTVRNGAARPGVHPGARGTALYATRTAVRSVDLATGRVRWTRRAERIGARTPRPVRGLALVATGDGVSAYDAEAGGGLRWTRSGVSELAASDGSLLTWGEDAGRGTGAAAAYAYVAGPEPGTRGGPGWGLHALDVRTGRTAWAVELDAIGAVRAAAAGGGLVHLLADGTLRTVRAPGRRR